MPLRFGVGFVLRHLVGALALDDLANLELPAPEYSWLALHLAFALRPKTHGGVWIDAAVMRWNYWMRSQVWLCVVALRQTDDLMEQDLVPAT